MVADGDGEGGLLSKFGLMLKRLVSSSNCCGVCFCWIIYFCQGFQGAGGGGEGGNRGGRASKSVAVSI